MVVSISTLGGCGVTLVCSMELIITVDTSCAAMLVVVDKTADGAIGIAEIVVIVVGAKSEC